MTEVERDFYLGRAGDVLDFASRVRRVVIAAVALAVMVGIALGASQIVTALTRPQPSEAFGAAAAVASLAGVAIYICRTLQGRTQPDRASWLIWAMEYTVLLGAQYARGARASLWLPLVMAAGVIITSALSWRRTAAPARPRPAWRAERLTTGCLVAACAAALVAWRYARNPALAIGLAVGVELAGAALTVRKVYRRPGTEPPSSWLLASFLGGLLDLGAVGGGPGILYAYPASLILMGLAIPAASMLGAHVVLGGRTYGREVALGGGFILAIGVIERGRPCQSARRDG